MEYTEENMADAEQYPSLGPEYFAARDIARRYMEHFKSEHFEALADEIGKAVRDKVWEDIDLWLLDDTEANLQSKIRDMVEATVRALLGGHEWALQKYALGGKYMTDGEKIRAAIAAHIPREIMDARIADLEDKVRLLEGYLEAYR